MVSLLTSRFGLAILAFCAAMAWHYIDKTVAVRNAEAALADKVTIETQAAKLKELQRRTEIAERTRLALEIQKGVAEERAAKADEELQQFAEQNQVNARCVVDDLVIERLRNR